MGLRGRLPTGAWEPALEIESVSMGTSVPSTVPLEKRRPARFGSFWERATSRRPSHGATHVISGAGSYVG